MLGDSPVILLIQGPSTAHPSVVLVGELVVGFNTVPQVIPLTDISCPPSETIVPPPLAEVEPMFSIGLVVVTVGKEPEAVVVKVPSVEYPVPVVFVAYPR